MGLVGVVVGVLAEYDYFELAEWGAVQGVEDEIARGVEGFSFLFFFEEKGAQVFHVGFPEFVFKLTEPFGVESDFSGVFLVCCVHDDGVGFWGCWIVF